VIQGQLGKRPVRLDSRTLKLSKYLPKVFPATPAEVSWVTKVPGWPVYLNNELGDCVPAAAAHCIEQWNFYSGKSFLPSDADVLKAYEDVGGYVPGNPSTDNGAVILDMLNYWRQTGVGGHKIFAFASVNWNNQDEVRAAIQIFGNLYIGIQLPISAQGQNDWTVPDGGIYSSAGQPGSWGGHAIPCMAASPETVTVITWGMRLKMSWNFFHDYVDEAYVCISTDWIEQNGVTPGMLNLLQLEQDLQMITSVKEKQ
jgi:hypothetical protein